MKQDNEVPVTTTCASVLISCSALVLILSLTMYYVYGIYYLVTGYKICKECSKSDLWSYVLTSLILGIFRNNVKYLDKDNNNNNNNNNDATPPPICILLCIGLLETGLAVWGGMELWVKSCNNLVDTNIWKFALATFCIHTTCASLVLIFVPCGIVYFINKIKELDSDQPIYV